MKTGGLITLARVVVKLVFVWKLGWGVVCVQRLPNKKRVNAPWIHRVFNTFFLGQGALSFSTDNKNKTSFCHWPCVCTRVFLGQGALFFFLLLIRKIKHFFPLTLCMYHVALTKWKSKIVWLWQDSLTKKIKLGSIWLQGK